MSSINKTNGIAWHTLTNDNANPATCSFHGLLLSQAPDVNECSSCWSQHLDCKDNPEASISELDIQKR